MYDIELTIKLRDWVYILLIGIVMGSMLSGFGYILLGHSWSDGALYGILLGFCITTFSLISITSMNKTILPNIEKPFWIPTAILFSFLSGFLGTQLSIYLALGFGIKVLALFEENMLSVSTFMGVMTYVVGALLYQFVKMRNGKEQVDSDYVQSRLKSLERQLNPHFLFNALNSIAELVHQDSNKAEEAILKLSSFLRNTMNEKALISLNEELKNVQEYVDLENIRFSGRIHLHQKSEKNALSVPKFSIQLLVENAIKHGFLPNQELHISVEVDGKAIHVSNDGKPILKKEFGIGLQNLDQRLGLLVDGYLEVGQSRETLFIIHLGGRDENTHR